MITALWILAVTLVAAEQLACRISFAREQEGIQQRFNEAWGVK